VRLGVFGGSFDPIHHGHLIAAAALAEELALDEVRLVVAREQPLKQGRHAAPAEDRAAMVALGVAGHERLRADRSELARPGPSYMVDTLKAFRTGRPDAELVLLLGADAAATLSAWRSPGEVRALARVEVFARGGSDGGPGVPQVPRVEISSSAIRERVRQGRSIRYWVPEAVAAYIADHGLYRED
jgi:nicotinate-nucleotide adenylyltransferase